jgi:hypothetical protein
MQPKHERRHHQRHHDLAHHHIVAIRVRPGHVANIVDVSAGGALIETHHRLLPGHVVELHVERLNDHARVRGRVLRCAVEKVRPASVCYRGAIAFERQLSWLVEPVESPVRRGDPRSALPAWAAVTPEVM